MSRTGTRTLGRAARAVLAAALCAGASAAPAAADSLVFTDGGNVFAAPDGGAILPLTTDGTPESPPYDQPDSPRGTLVGPYFSASADDQGRLLAARAYRSDDGSDGGVFWNWHGPDGSSLARRMVSMSIDCGGPFSRPLGPAAGRLHPAGRWVAFMYQCGGETKTAINFPDRQTEPWFSPPQWGFAEPTWFGDQLVATDMTRVVAQRGGDPAPFSDDWLMTDVGGADLRFGRTEYTRDGTRAATLLTIEGGRLLALLRTAPPLSGGAEPSLQCFVPARGTVTTLSWSSDGTRLAWRDDAGVQIATVPARDWASESDPLCPMQPQTVSATGRDPVFTAYTYGAEPAPGPGPGPGGGGGTPPGGGGGGGTPPAGGGGSRGGRAPQLALPKRVTAKALRRGVPLTVRVAGAGRVTVTARLGRRTVVAKGAATARRAGSVRPTLRLTAAGRRARLAGRRLAIRAVFAPRGGGRRVAVGGTLRVR